MPARIGSPLSGCLAHLARQRQKLDRLAEVDRGWIEPLRQADALRLFAVAELEIRAEAPVPRRDVKARRLVLAEHLHAVSDRLVPRSHPCHWRRRPPKAVA